MLQLFLKKEDCNIRCGNQVLLVRYPDFYFISVYDILSMSP